MRITAHLVRNLIVHNVRELLMLVIQYIVDGHKNGATPIIFGCHRMVVNRRYISS